MASCSIASCESTAVPNWLELPTDITANILQRLSTFEIVKSVRNVCPIWWNIFKDPLMWRTIRITRLYDFPYYIYHQSTEICHYAIKQSCGHLEYISIEYFAHDDLLEFIVENASNLRHLRLVYCYGISNEGFCKAVKKLPLLEELDIQLCDLSSNSLEVVGQYCPLLTSLQLVISGFGNQKYDIYEDEEFVIAKSMSGLRHLNIVLNEFSNDGLLAILEGCPHLESLDIRRCYDLQLDESLRNKCLDQIKNLHLPDPAVYYYYDDYFDNVLVTYLDSITDEDSYDPYD